MGPPDAHFQLASQMEADSPPALVDGMSSPALMLLEFQRDARNHFTAQVAEVVDAFETVGSTTSLAWPSFSR